MHYSLDPQLKELETRIIPESFLSERMLMIKEKMNNSPRTRLWQIDGVTVNAHTVSWVNNEEISLHEIIPQGYENRKLNAMYIIHGGGFVTDVTTFQANIAARYAIDMKMAVIIVDYRLAPAHPFPAPLDDCTAGWKYIVEKLGYRNIALEATSSGAALACSMIMKLHDEKYDVMPKCIVLNEPALDDSCSTKSMEIYSTAPIWDGTLSRRMWELYGKNGKGDVPYLFSPYRCEDLSFFPPCRIETAEHCCFRDEGRMFSERLPDCTYNEIKGACHGFERVSCDITDRAIREREGFILSLM